MIGEEIYDEFDTEGARHGEVTSYIPPQFVTPDLLPSLKRKGSAPQLSARPDTLRPVPPAQAAQRSSSVSGTPVLRPIAIPAFKGLSFLTGRSRSAPPVPRDGSVRRTPSAQPTPSTASEINKEEKLKPEASVSVVDTYTIDCPEIVIAPPPVDIPATPAPAYLPPFATTATTTGPSTPPAVALPIEGARQGTGSSGASRSTSPGPSLSKALLRARRPASTHIARSQGRGFKSNPLGGVPGHVLRLGEQPQPQTQGRASEEPRDENASGSTRTVAGAEAQRE